MEVEEIRQRLGLLSVHEQPRRLRERLVAKQDVCFVNRQTGRTTEACLKDLHHLSVGRSVAVAGSTLKVSERMRELVRDYANRLDISADKLEISSPQEFIHGQTKTEVIVFDHSVREGL